MIIINIYIFDLGRNGDMFLNRRKRQTKLLFSQVFEIWLSDSQPTVITTCAILANGVLSMIHFLKRSLG